MKEERFNQGRSDEHMDKLAWMHGQTMKWGFIIFVGLIIWYMIDHILKFCGWIG